MKQISFYLLLLLLLSCNQNIVKNMDLVANAGSSEDYVANESEAKIWFQGLNNSNARKSIDGNVLEADWDKVINNGYFLEMPILFNSK